MNFLPNSQWQLWASLVYGSNPITKMNSAGAANQAPISCTGFVIGTPVPTFFTPNTQQLKIGDLVVIGSGFQWGFGGVGFVPTPTAVRVIAINPNVSFTAVGPLGGAGISPLTSFACTATPITAGDNGSGLGYCADGWAKDGPLVVWADDFAANSCIGAIRTLGIRKTTSSVELIEWSCPANDIARYAGKTITFGALVYQKTQGGAGTWNLAARDYVNAEVVSSVGTGSSYSDPTYGGFEFISVTATISKATQDFRLRLYLNGNAGDVYYVALPTAVVGSLLSRDGCGQVKGEIITPKCHWNPPLLTPLAQTFSTVFFPGAPLYGWSGIDIEAISHGTVHKSVSMLKCKIEFTCPTIEATLLTTTQLPDPIIFGPQVTTQVPNIRDVGQGWLPLKSDGTFALCTGSPGLVISNATFDFDCVMA